MVITASTFFEPKKGNSDQEWEDCVAVACGDPVTGRNPRFIVADGATEAYDAIRWVHHIADSFMSPDGPPRLDRVDMLQWLSQLQYNWQAKQPTHFTSRAAQRKAAEGSYATLLGCEIDLGSDPIRWEAVNVGDTVLFHVRDDRLIDRFPRLRPQDFTNTPGLIYSRNDMFGETSARLSFSKGDLAMGDQLFVATDALARWMLVSNERHGKSFWQQFDEVNHPATFHQLIGVLRHNNEIANDDVTVLRLRLVDESAPEVVVCL